jgi:hypothetical protein
LSNCELSDAGASFYGELITLWEDQENGSWNSALAARRSDSDYHPARASLALTEESQMALASQSAPATAVIVDESPSSSSAVSWAAIIGGALTAVAVTLLLVALGAGIGLSSVSPWSSSNPTVTTFTLLAAVWLIIVQWLSSGLGGYLAGRLRTKWVGLHTDEVFFRDTAHGFLAWALASVLVAVFATSSVSSAVRTATHAISSVAGSAASGATQVAATQSPGPTDYFLHTLFRRGSTRCQCFAAGRPGGSGPHAHKRTCQWKS